MQSSPSQSPSLPKIIWAYASLAQCQAWEKEWRSIRGWRWQVIPIRPTSAQVQTDQANRSSRQHDEWAFIIGHFARNTTGWQREVIPVAPTWPVLHANDVPLSIVMSPPSYPDDYRRRVQLLEQAAHTITTPWVLIADPPLFHSPQWLPWLSHHYVPAMRQLRWQLFAPRPPRQTSQLLQVNGHHKVLPRFRRVSGRYLGVSFRITQ